MAAALLTDQCLWLKHIEAGAVRDAMASLEPGSTINLALDGDVIAFQRMATGVDGRETAGFNPVGDNARIWRERYVPGTHQSVTIEFAGSKRA